MNEFLAYLWQFGRLTPHQQEVVAQKATRVTLRKSDYFVEAGAVAQRVGFVEAGVLRVYSSTEQGEERTRYFIEEGHLILDVRAPGAPHPEAPCLVQAVTACRLVVFTAQQWQTFFQLIPGWETIVHKIIAQAMREKMARVLPMVGQDAAARYTSFLTNYPQLANRVPLTYLASYLGITPSSLSRVRKHIR
ncbi:Crp/Fnr family transcriptional regulator [Hymenobacter bucti]|uniref:Crp/Fnr family transcriptional regulator n=1 Tax=Hymenobacter bucti TaxID=1844114 RepID=A0ABW4R253_9BACT